jgi:hypothetical protein
VILDGLVDDAIAADVLDELPRTGRDRQPLGAVVLGGLDVALGLDERDGGEEPLVHLVAEHHERFLEAHGERVGVLDLHALDEAELRRQRVGGAVLRDGREREPDVLGRELAASAVELDALANVEGPGAAAVRDLPALGQHGGELAGLGVAGEEILEHGLEDDVLGPDVQVGQPPLVAERGDRDGQGSFRLGRLALRGNRGHQTEGRDDHRSDPASWIHDFLPARRLNVVVRSGQEARKRRYPTQTVVRPVGVYAVEILLRRHRRAGNRCLRVASRRP